MSSNRERPSVDTCRLCGADAIFLATGNVLGRHEASYFRCPRCLLVQTEQPYWLAEAYSDALSRADVGIVQRNLDARTTTSAILTTYFDRTRRFVDYGAGSGLLVRLMRDAGYDFYWTDKFADNTFAKEFVAGEPDRQYELLTAFEVFEHLVMPHEEVKRMLRFSRSILFSTLLMPSDVPKPGQWWYYLLETGQHVSLFSYETLQWLARDLGLNLYSNGSSLHLLTDKTLRPDLFRYIAKWRVASLITRFSRLPSRINDDFVMITGRKPQ